MKDPEIITIDNRPEYYYKKAKILWEGQFWSDYKIYTDKAKDGTDKSYAQMVVFKGRQLG